jgi:RNA polymerase sigma-70 factor (ECF subfamily)
MKNEQTLDIASPSGEELQVLDGETQTETLRSTEFEALVLEHMNMLHAVAWRLTRNSTEAEDLVQDTIVKALRFHSRFEEGTHIKAWLLTILRNTFINGYRQKTRRPQQVELTGAETATDNYSPDPMVRSSWDKTGTHDAMELLGEEVRSAVDSLPSEFRSTVVMADLEGSSYKEIAAVLGCPMGTVMSRIHRGRRMLRAQLTEYARQYRYAEAST